LDVDRPRVRELLPPRGRDGARPWLL
jgi:hypothetical protein